MIKAIKYDKTKNLHITCRKFLHPLGLIVYIYKPSELCLSEHKYSAYDTNNKVKRKERAVVEEGVEVFSHTVGSPLTPDGNACDKVTDKAKHDYGYDADVDINLGIFR